MDNETQRQMSFITTVDNPFNPFTQFDDWYSYDNFYGYNCCGLLATFAKVSDDLSETDYELEIERAIKHIIANDHRNIYRRVSLELVN